FLTTIRALMISLICMFGFAGVASAQTWTIDDYHYYYSLKSYHELVAFEASERVAAAQTRLTGLDSEYEWRSRTCPLSPYPGECYTALSVEKDEVYNELTFEIATQTAESAFHSNEAYEAGFILAQIENYLWP